MPTFEWTVRAGDVLTLLGAVVVAGGFLYRRGAKEIAIEITLRALTEQLAEMKTEFKTFGETLKKVGIQEVQISLLMKWYDELRRGEGYVRGSRSGVDGEYP
jgi:hypothetical protein